MSISFAIPSIGGSGADVTVYQLDQSDLALLSLGARNGRKYADYIVSGSDPAHPVTVSVEVIDPTKTNKMRVWTLRLSAWATATESITGLVTYRPVNVSMEISTPADLAVEVADLIQMVENLYGLSFKTLDTKVPSTEIVSAMLYGTTQVW